MERTNPMKRTSILSGSAGIAFTVLLVTSAILTAIACASAHFHEKTDANRPPDEINIELTGNGFIPTQVTHSAGAFGIAVENKSSTNDYTLRLKAENGTVLHEITVQKGSVAWSVDLQPGTYMLTEVNHEQWVCVLTVQ